MSKKLINNGDDAVDEMLEGILAAHGDILRRVEHSPRSVVGTHAPTGGKVGVLIGGGSGHEPAFVGYVGKGLADAAAVGNVFASPSPDPILEATKAIDGGAGVVYLYGNYAGDVMNFDMASEMAELEGIDVRTVVVTDDVASSPPDRREDRRGIAGDVFVFKIAGAAADKGYDLDGVVAAARKANAATVSMGVGLSACSLPQTLKPHFELGEDEMEIGLGVHGEPGVQRGPLQPADRITDALLDRLFVELSLDDASRVAVLVNGLGSTPLMEQYIVFRRVSQCLAEKGVSIHVALVGNYVSSLEMAGCSVTLMKLDDELTALLDHPARCAMFRTG